MSRVRSAAAVRWVALSLLAGGRARRVAVGPGADMGSALVRPADDAAESRQVVVQPVPLAAECPVSPGPARRSAVGEPARRVRSAASPRARPGVAAAPGPGAWARAGDAPGRTSDEHETPDYLKDFQHVEDGRVVAPPVIGE